MGKYNDKIVNTFNAFNGRDFSMLDQFYAQDVSFEDPVGKVQGLPALKKYYGHAYANVKSIKFDFSQIIEQGQVVAAPWVMTISVQGLNKGELYQVHGASILVFNEQDLVISHRDYVDLGEMVYERLPLQGFIIRKIKALLSGDSKDRKVLK